MESRHLIRVFIVPNYVDLRVECHSPDNAECKIENGDGNGATVCRYVQWWDEAEVSLEEFYMGEEELLCDNSEIDIYWDGEYWAWELKKND